MALETIAKKDLDKMMGELVSFNQETGVKTYRLTDGRYFVKIDPYSVLWKLKKFGYDPYNKIARMDSMPDFSSKIARANFLVKDGKRNIGFGVPSLGDDGNISLYDYFDSVSVLGPDDDALIDLPEYDLAPRTIAFTQLEDIVKNEPRIVFPDMASGGNVIVDSNGNVYIVDINGMQVDNRFIVDSISDVVSDIPKLDILNNGGQKYLVNGNPLMYTKELDKASLISLYFKAVFDCDVGRVLGSCEDSEERTATIEEIFNLIGFENEADLGQALWKIWEPVPNDWLGDIVPAIADKYRIVRQQPTGEAVVSSLMDSQFVLSGDNPLFGEASVISGSDFLSMLLDKSSCGHTGPIVVSSAPGSLNSNPMRPQAKVYRR